MVFAAAMGSIILSCAPVAADDNAAHTLADKFSRAAEDAERAKAAKTAEAERKRAAERALQLRRESEARRKAYEEDMLARARAEAAARRAQEKRLAEERARAEEKRRAEAARIAKEAKAKRLAEQRRRAAEAAKLAKAAEEKRRKAEAARVAREAEAKRLAEEQRKAARTRAVLEALRAEQARRIVRKFQRAREKRMRAANARKNGLSDGRPPVTNFPDPWHLQKKEQRPPVAELDRAWPDEDDDLIATKYPARVTVLLIMEPRGRGRRRYQRAAYPVLCVGRRCYISAGAEETAHAKTRPQALGPFNSLGRRAGRCNNQLACVFRGVTLNRDPSYIQPIDMGLLRHKRRDIRKAEPDRTCTVTHGSLHCASVIIAHRYRAWIVPEAVAEEAGPEALKDALDNGLTTTRSARLVKDEMR